jgi:hypothetical protein
MCEYFFILFSQVLVFFRAFFFGDRWTGYLVMDAFLDDEGNMSDI